jgi:energy-coupling factor transporter ATP-binding protein EcfA2
LGAALALAGREPQEPQFVVLDEPTASLDFGNGEEHKSPHRRFIRDKANPRASSVIRRTPDLRVMLAFLQRANLTSFWGGNHARRGVHR